ncbi:RNA polymerase sigma factor SigF, partial [Kitasatospora sp. NPDC004531]
MPVPTDELLLSAPAAVTSDPIGAPSLPSADPLGAGPLGTGPLGTAADSGLAWDALADPANASPADARELSRVLLRRLADLEEGTREFSYVRATLIELNLTLVRFAIRRFG